MTTDTPATTTRKTKKAGHGERDRLILHQALAGLAGRIPDDLLTAARAWLVEGRLADLAVAVAGEVGTRGLALPLEHRTGLARLVEDDHLRATLEQVATTEVDAPTTFEFAAEPPENTTSAKDSAATDGEDPPNAVKAKPRRDRVERAVARAATKTDGVRGVWLSWRTPPGGRPWPEPRRVVVVEVASPARPYEVAADIAAATRSAAAAGAGEPVPQVECYATGDRITPYTRSARDAGRLLWAHSRERVPALARTFDHGGSDESPGFDPDHPLIEGAAERKRLLRYLDGGTILIESPTSVPDRWDPDRGDQVPTALRTDGAWIWADAVAYYLREHRLSPEPDFLAHLRAVEERTPQVDGVDVYRAMAVLDAEEPT
ncbi:MAG: hypothetical protein ACRCXL_07945 [Dermatophilaceae bacterium]